LNFSKSEISNESSNRYIAAANSAIVQRSIAIGAVDDPLEHEADAVADKVMRMPANNFTQRKCPECEEEDKVQRKPLASFIQKLGNDSGTKASDSVSQRINSTKGGGSNMDSGTKSFMESRFETDFSGVKIHTGDYAVQMSQELNAQAFTVGNDVYFNSGKFNPDNNGGKQLLAHELTHVLQQSGLRNNAQNKIQRQAAPPAKKTIWLHIGFDSSAQADTNTMKKLRASIAAEESAIASCCSTKAKACDVQIKPLYDWNRNNKPAPSDGDYDSDIAADLNLRDNNIKNINTGKAGGIRLLVTGSTLSQTWQGVRLFANANSGADNMIWNVNVAPDETLSHETGHIAGYSGGDIEGNVHSSDPDNLMSRGDIRNAGALPDTNWCEKVAALAV
jgi:hypothetical protein